MTIYYVDLENGNDSSSGNNWTNAWKTIKNNISKLVLGDEMRVAKTSSAVFLSAGNEIFNKSGNSNNIYKIYGGWNKTTDTIDGETYFKTSDNGFYLSGSDYWDIKYFSVSGANDFDKMPSYDKTFCSSVYASHSSTCALGFDGIYGSGTNYTNAWESNEDDTAWLGVSYNNPIVFNKIELHPRYDTAGTRCPSKFEIRGGFSEPTNGLTEGTVLLSVSGASWSDSSDPGKSWIFNNNNSYNYYWITCLDKTDAFGKGAEYTIAELIFFNSSYNNIKIIDSNNNEFLLNNLIAKYPINIEYSNFNTIESLDTINCSGSSGTGIILKNTNNNLIKFNKIYTDNYAGNFQYTANDSISGSNIYGSNGFKCSNIDNSLYIISNKINITNYPFYFSDTNNTYISNTTIPSGSLHNIYILNSDRITHNILFSNCNFDETNIYDASTNKKTNQIKFQNHNTLDNNFVCYIRGIYKSWVKRNTTNMKSGNDCIEIDVNTPTDKSYTIWPEIFNIKSTPSAHNYIKFYTKATSGFSGKSYKMLELNKSIVDNASEMNLSTSWDRQSLSHIASNDSGWYNIKLGAYGIGKFYVDEVSHIISKTVEKYYYTLKIDSSKIDSNLSNFPVLINISSSAGINGIDNTNIFNSVGSDFTKIKIKDENSNTLYTEVENWDSINKKGSLWVNVPNVSASTDINLYLHYLEDNNNQDYISDDPSAKAINLNIDKSSEGTYDTSKAYGGCIIKESDTSYKMWYSGYDGSYWRIIYCTSTDGINWSNFQMVVDKGSEGTYDSNGARYPYVIKESDTSYKMWYGGRNSSSIETIIYCTSTNGTSWSNFQRVINTGSEGTYDTDSIYSNIVIKESDTSYKMWYAGSDGTYIRIIYCTSSNGTSWSNFQMVIDKGSEGTYDTNFAINPHVIKESDTSYKMWYAGYDGSNYRIIYCTSSNGTSWSNFQMVVDKGSEGTYDTTHSYVPFVLKESSNLYKMWYTGNNGSYDRILYTTSENEITWTKNVANRVWDDSFAAVYHMSQSPTGGSGSIFDSTSNNYNGTPNGSMTASDLIDGKTSKALDFDGINDDITTTGWNPNGSSQVTEEVIFNIDTFDASSKQALFTSYSGSNAAFLMDIDTDNKLRGNIVVGGSSQIVKSAVINKNQWYYGSYKWKSPNAPKLNLNITQSLGSTISGTINKTGSSWSIASWNGVGRYFDGKIQEVRISKIERSDAWVKATYYTCFDNLITYS